MISTQDILREVRAFQFYKTRIWPIQRHFIKHRLTPRCTRCFLPHTCAPLENGVCRICREIPTTPPSQEPGSREQLQAELDRLMTSVLARTGLDFHALVLFSGGKDSTFLLHTLRTRYPDLRLLAMTLDNTFMSPVAMDNIAAVIAATGIGHVMVRPGTRLMEKMFRYAFTRSQPLGCSATVDQFDGDFFCDAARNLAARMNIPYIFCGLSRDQVRHILGLDTFITRAAAEAQPRTRVAGIELTRIFNRHEMKYWWDGSAWPAERRPRMIFPFFIRDYEEGFIRSRVRDLGLIRPGHDSPLATNSRLVPLMGLADMARQGYSSFEPEFARMVRLGKADRKEWLYTFETLEYAVKTGRFLGKSVKQAMDRLSLTMEDLGMGGRHNG
ncbi:MAG: hypothetical protein V6Z89_21810 [Desulfobacter sp.]